MVGSFKLHNIPKNPLNCDCRKNVQTPSLLYLEALVRSFKRSLTTYFTILLLLSFFVRGELQAARVVPYLHSCPAILGGRVQDMGHPRAHQGPQIHPEDLRGAVHRVLRGLTLGPFGSGSRCFVFIFWTCQNIHLSADLLHQVRTKTNIIRL